MFMQSPGHLSKRLSHVERAAVREVGRLKQPPWLPGNEDSAFGKQGVNPLIKSGKHFTGGLQSSLVSGLAEPE